MSRRALVRLKDRYRGLSRMSRWRLRKEPGFPTGVVILGSEFHYEDELEEYESHRRTGTGTAVTTDASGATDETSE